MVAVVVVVLVVGYKKLVLVRRFVYECNFKYGGGIRVINERDFIRLETCLKSLINSIRALMSN
jgi:hypothetical protein